MDIGGYGDLGLGKDADATLIRLSACSSHGLPPEAQLCEPFEVSSLKGPIVTLGMVLGDFPSRASTRERQPCLP